MRQVLLTDYGNNDLPGEMPGLFKRAGCAVDVYCAKRSWLRKNHSFDAWLPAEPDPKNYADRLCALADSGKYDWIVLTDDESLRVARDFVDDGHFAKILPLLHAQDRDLLGSKAVLSRRAAACGITTPPFAVYTGTTSIMELAEEVSYPLFLKVDESSSGAGVFLCRTAAELRLTFAKLKDHKKRNLVLQKQIMGDIVCVEALYKRGELIAAAHSRVLTTLHDAFGVSSSREYVADELHRAELERIGSAFRLNGFCSYTFIREKGSGAQYLIEADLRTHGWFAYSRHAGTDFAVAIRDYLEDTRTPEHQASGPVLIPHFSRSIEGALIRGDIRELVAWACNKGDRWRFVTPDRRLIFATLSAIARRHVHRTLPYRFWTRLKRKARAMKDLRAAY